MNYPRQLLVAAALLVTLPAQAEVQEAREGFFRIQSVILVEASPATAYRALVRISAWWDPAHTWSGASKNLSIDARAGGCFCEKLKGGGSVQHAQVVFAQPGQLLRMNGALGPLQEMPVTGVLTYALAPDGPGTRVTLTYQVSGVMSMAADKLAVLVEQVMGGQFERFRGYVNAQAAR
jgi:hypothetical protein